MFIWHLCVRILFKLAIVLFLNLSFFSFHLIFNSAGLRLVYYSGALINWYSEFQKKMFGNAEKHRMGDFQTQTQIPDEPDRAFLHCEVGDKVETFCSCSL